MQDPQAAPTSAAGELFRARLKARYPEPGPGVGDYAQSVGTGLARGAIEGTSSIAGGAARAVKYALTGGPSELDQLRAATGLTNYTDVITRAEDVIGQFARTTFPSSEAIEKAGGAARFFAQTLPEFVGSAVPYLAGGEVAAAAKLPSLVAQRAVPMMLAGLASGESGYLDAKAQGADEQTAWASFALNAGAGAGAMGLGPLPEILAGAQRTTAGLFKHALQNAGVTAAQTFAADAIAEQLYTDEKRISVQRMLEQGALGGLSSVFLEGLDRSYKRLMEPPKAAAPKVAELPKDGPREDIPPAKPVPGKAAPAVQGGEKPRSASESGISTQSEPSPIPVGAGEPSEAGTRPPGQSPTSSTSPEPQKATQPPAATPEPARQLVGHPSVGPTQIELSDGRTLRAGYAIVEASSLQPSHLPKEGFRANPLGDKNERPYDHPTEGLELRSGVQARAENLKPAFLLSDTPSGLDGPPVVKGDGSVLGGNGRTMSVQLAYGSGKAEAYRQGVTEWAQRRGMDISALKEPVLVRVIADADAGARGELSRLLNEGHGMGKTSATEAVSRGSKIDVQAAQEIAALIGSDGSLRDVLSNPSTGAAVLSTLVRSGALSQADLMAFTDKGALNEAGKQAIENALLGAAIPDVYALRGAQPALRQAVFYSLPGIVRARGAWPEISQHIATAMEALSDATAQRTTVDEARRQVTIEPRPWTQSREGVALARAMEGRTQKTMRALFADMAESLASWKSGQGSLLGPPPRTPIEAFWSVMHDLGIQGHAVEQPPGDASPNKGQIPEFFGRPGQEFVDPADLDPGQHGAEQAADPILGGASEEVYSLEVDQELARPGDPFTKGAIGTPIGYRDLTGELSSMGHDWDGEHVPSRQQIVKGYANLLQIMGKTGAEFRTRRIGTGKEAKATLGVFFIKSGVLRLARDGDISTAPHEFGHALEKTLFGIDMRKGNPFGAEVSKDLPITNKQLMSELEMLGRRLYPDGEPHIILREGWAEFWREWFNAPENIAKLAPSLTAWVEGPDVFGKWPELQQGSERVRDMVDAWRRAGGLLRIASQTKNPETIGEKKQDLIDRVRAWSLQESFIEVGHNLRDLQEMAEKQLAGKLRTDLPKAKVYPEGGAQGPPALKRLTGIQRLERAFDLFDQNRMASGPVARWFISEHTYDINFQKTGESLVTSLAPAKSGGWDLFSIYLIAKRTISIWTDPLGARDPGISMQDAIAALDDIQKTLTPEQFAGFEVAQHNYEVWFRNVNRYAAQMSATAARDVRAMRALDVRRRQMNPEWRPNYAPFKRADLGVFSDVLRGYSSNRGVRSGILKKMHGSGKRIIDPVFEAGLEAERRIQGAHNFAVIDAVRRLERITEDAGHLIVKVEGEKYKSHNPTYDYLLDQIEKSLNKHQEAGAESVDIRKLLQDNGVDAAVLEDGLGDRLAMFSDKPPGPNGRPTVALWNAETRGLDYYELTPGMEKALTGMNPYRLQGALAFLEHGLFQVPKQVFTMGTTGMRLTFSWLTNPMRDVQTLYMNTASGKGAPFLAWTWAKTMRAALSSALTGKHGDWAMELVQKSGVSMETPLAQDTKHVDAVLNKAFGRKNFYQTIERGWDWTKMFMQVPELVTRATEIKALADSRGWKPGMPMDPQLAMDLILAGKRVSTNFTAAGDVARAFNRVAPFFNASIQGPYATWKAAKRNPAGFMLRGLSMAASSAALWLLVKDQDWYKELSPKEKYTYWHVPVTMFGEPVVWRVPMAHEIGIMFGAMPMAMLDALHEQDPQAALDWAGSAVQQTMPNVMPVIFNEVLEQASNRDFYSGMPIVPRGQEDMPAEEQFGDYTTKASIVLGRMFGWSPRRIDHMIRGTAGSAAIDLLALGGRGTKERPFITEPSDVPVVGALFQRGGTAGTQPRSVTDLYDLYGEYYGRSRSTRNPEAPEDRQRRLRLQDATQAVSALTYVRSHTADAAKRAEITRETIAIAKEALDLVRGRDVYNPGDLGWKAKAARREKEAMKRSQLPGQGM